MGSLVNLIDTSLIEEHSIDLDEFIDKYKDNATLKEELLEHSVFNNFNSDRWVFFNPLNQTNIYFDFKIFNALIDKDIIEELEVSLIKCFLVDKLDEGIAPTTLRHYLNNIYSLIYITNNFDKDTIYSSKDILIMDTLLTGETPYVIIGKSTLIDYINFLESINCVTEEHLVVLSYLYDTKLLNKDYDTRKLPSTKDIMSFDFYLKKYFKEAEPDTELNLYKPVLLWWKITNVIPLRPSEFAYKLKRDCLIAEDDKFYLKIDRVKVNPDKLKKKKRRATIPILKKLEISKEIYDMVLDYINCTSFDTETKTLFSYLAYKTFNYKTYRTHIDDVKDFLKNTKQIKKYTEHFNTATFQDIIDLFYKKIIFGKYQDNTIKEKLTVGDTRHLAFCSLMLQGVSPIEIAMLGGHTNLESQDAYIGHAKYYIDSEMLNYISNRMVKPEINNKELKKIILSMPYTPDKSIVECMPTDDKIGYCTVDIEKEVCDNNNRPCIFCSKWWCYPSIENFVKAKKYLNEDYLGPLMSKLESDEKFLSGLLKSAKVVNINGLLELEKSDDEKIKSQVMKIKSTANEILFVKKVLLEINSNKRLTKKHTKKQRSMTDET